jgi:hypothetical protein
MYLQSFFLSFTDIVIKAVIAYAEIANKFGLSLAQLSLVHLAQADGATSMEQ